MDQAIKGCELDEISPHWITPQWPAPAHVRAFVTTRMGGINAAPYNGFNTADHVGDDPSVISNNRAMLQQHFGWAVQPRWLNQVHGVQVEQMTSNSHQALSDTDQSYVIDADAIVTSLVNVPCAIHTADCLPVFFTDKLGTKVALAHAGWRGLLEGVLENTLACFEETEQVYVWLGPAISQGNFEVGSEVFKQFVAVDTAASVAFKASGDGKYLCDLYALARQRLEAKEHCVVYGGDYCTYDDPRFFSYRRESTTGRMLSLLWIDPDQ